MDLVEATDDDVEVLAEYWYALATEMEPYSELNELAVDHPREAEAGFERQFERDDTTVFLLVAEGENVGYLLLREGERSSLAHSAYGEIVDLFVADGHRGQGHGSEAIEATKRIAADRGENYLTASCEWHNDGARRFYADNGFEEKQVTFAHRLDEQPSTQ